MTNLSFLVDDSEIRTLEKERIEIIEKAALNTGATPEILIGYAVNLMATPVRELRDPSKALMFVQKAVAAIKSKNQDLNNMLGLAYRMTGNLDMAISTLEDMLPSLNAFESKPRTANEILLIDCYRRKGDIAASEELLRSMMARLNKRDPVYLEIVQRMTDVFLLLIDWDELRWIESIHGRLTGFRSGHWPFEMVGKDDLGERLARKYIEQKRFGRAEQLLQESLAIRKLALPQGHWRTGVSSVLLAQSLVGQRKFEEAEPLLLQGHSILTAAVETIPDHLKERITRGVAQTAIDLYEAWGKPDKAAQYRAIISGE